MSTPPLSKKRLSIPIISFGILIVVMFVLYGTIYPEKAPLSFVSFEKEAVYSIHHQKEASVNQPFVVSIKVDTQGEKINAVGLYMRFNPQEMQLLDLDTKSSFCQFYPEKKFDNNLGTISLACGSPHPGVEGENTIMNLEFLPLMVGTSTLHMTPDSQILTSDGKGTNILKEYPQTTINIFNSF